jgi:hypothetical protein
VIDRLFNKGFNLLNTRRRTYMRTSDAPKPKDDLDLARTRNTLVLDQAREAGLLGGRKAARISGRIPAALLNAAKKRAHVSSIRNYWNSHCRVWYLKTISAGDSCDARGRFRSALILSSDLDAALRWLKPQRYKVCPRQRSEEKLPWAEDEPLVGGPLMLDKSVYIDLLLGRTPVEVDRLIQIRICDHSAVCLAELTHAFGRLDPAHPDTKITLREIRRTVNEDIPPHRSHSPGTDLWRVAGILAGLVWSSDCESFQKAAGMSGSFSTTDCCTYKPERQAVRCSPGTSRISIS